MKAESSEAIRYHLKETEVALEELLSAMTFLTIERGWSRLISEGNLVLDALISAPETGKEKQWTEKIRRDQRSDPLVSYCHQARNAYHHGLRKIVVRKAGTPTLWGKDRPITKKAIPAGIIPGRVELAQVTNRGKTYDPPVTDPRLPKPNNSPGSTAIAFVTYLKEKAAEAASL